MLLLPFKINYMRTHKRSTTRDFRILHKELESAVREQEESMEDLSKEPKEQVRISARGVENEVANPF